MPLGCSMRFGGYPWINFSLDRTCGSWTFLDKIQVDWSFLFGHVWSLQWHRLVSPTDRCGLVGPVCAWSVDVDLLVLCVPPWKWICGSYICSSVEMDLWVLYMCSSVEMDLWGLYVFLRGSGLVGPMCSSVEMDLWVLYMFLRGNGLVGPMCSSVEVDLWVLYVFLCGSGLVGPIYGFLCGSWFVGFYMYCVPPLIWTCGSYISVCGVVGCVTHSGFLSEHALVGPLFPTWIWTCGSW